MNKDKNNALNDFKSMIAEAWTYNRLTDKEKHHLSETFDHLAITRALKGTYHQRWDTLNAIYYAFICALGYTDDPIDWRGDDE